MQGFLIAEGSLAAQIASGVAVGAIEINYNLPPGAISTPFPIMKISCRFHKCRLLFDLQ